MCALVEACGLLVLQVEEQHLEDMLSDSADEFFPALQHLAPIDLDPPPPSSAQQCEAAQAPRGSL